MVQLESDSIPSPALIFFFDRIERNITQAIETVGSPRRLRPHVKTHKCPQIVRMKIDAGISKFKCATLAEVKMLAQSGAEDILLAYQPVGPTVKGLIELIEANKNARISCIVDSVEALGEIAATASQWNVRIPVFIDFDVGMNRTGVLSIETAVTLAKEIDGAGGTLFKGIHAYDGHNKDPDPEVKKRLAADTVNTLDALRDELKRANLDVEEIVVGGTPMFTQYAPYSHLTPSPGTLFLHDWESAKHSDLPYEFAAMILSRVVSIPGNGNFTIDAGAKAISMDHPERAALISYPEAVPGPISEEHWIFTSKNGAPKLAETMFLVPAHVCTAVHHFDKAFVVDDNGKLLDTWPITARGRI